VEDKDLAEIDILPLERKRFLAKLTKCADAKSQPEKGPVHTVYMPSSSFGHSVIDVSEEYLMKEYGNLYYVSPQNFKQKKTNEFILNMCSSSRWRFSSKSSLEVWAREERRVRCVALNAYADAAEVKDETKYYKEQCFMFQLHNLKEEYADIDKLSLSKPEDIQDNVKMQKKRKIMAV
jgi:hypothetical protein